MLGPAQSRDLDERLDDERLDDERLDDERLDDERLDLGFVRAWVRDAYSNWGRPAIDPVVFFTFYPVMFFEGIRSERQIFALAADRLSVRWSLGYLSTRHYRTPLASPGFASASGSRSSAASSSAWSTYAKKRASSGGRRSSPRRPGSPATPLPILSCQAQRRRGWPCGCPLRRRCRRGRCGGRDAIRF
jgi:hypothetical protein